MAACANPGSPGYSTRAMSGRDKRNSATRCAVCCICRILNASVGSPWTNTGHALFAERTPPKSFRNSMSMSLLHFGPITTPPMSVPKPPIPFVSEWTTKSIPRASGRWQKGVANVLSTMV